MGDCRAAADCRAAIPAFYPIIPAKAGIQMAGARLVDGGWRLVDSDWRAMILVRMGYCRGGDFDRRSRFLRRHSRESGNPEGARPSG